AERNAGDGVYVVAVSTHAYATIRRSVLSSNGGAAVFAVTPTDPAQTNLSIEDSVIANNAGDGLTVGGNSTGMVFPQVRRNSIVGNGLSGISAFTIDTATALSHVIAADNSFGYTGTNCLSGSGRAEFYVTGNDFGSPVTFSFNITGLGLGYTYG